LTIPPFFPLAKGENGLCGKLRNKKSRESLYLTISDQDLLDAIDRMKFNGEEVENGGVFSNKR